jgi:hypothetical protein
MENVGRRPRPRRGPGPGGGADRGPTVPAPPAVRRPGRHHPGYAGVYSSFLLHAQRAAQRYGAPAHEILQRVGEAGYVGGQKDMINDVVLNLAAELERGGV